MARSRDKLEHGVLLMERSDADQGAVLRAWLDQSVTYGGRDNVSRARRGVRRRTHGHGD